MKKILSALAAAALVFTGLVPFAASADDSAALGFYFKAREGGFEGTISEDGSAVYIPVDSRPIDGTIDVTVDVYVNEPELTAWYVSPKWKSSSPLVKLANLVDPKDPENIRFAYAETDDDGSFIRGKYGTIVSTDENYNTMGFTCMYSSYFSKDPLIPYGEKSDSYPLTSFELHIDKDIPTGDYNVHFLSSPEDYDDQRTCEINQMTADGPKAAETLSLSDLDVIVYRPYDVDNNNEITAADASTVLAAYAKLSTSGSSGLTKFQFCAADTDHNGELSSTDASDILKYYAKISTDVK